MITKEYPELLPKLDGFSIHPYRGEQDLPAMVEVFNLSSQADGADWTTNLNEMAEEYQLSEHFCPQRDSLQVEANGQLVAFGEVRHYCIHENNSWQHRVDGQVLPAWRNRGIGSALLDYSLAVSQDLNDNQRGTAQRCLHTYAWDADSDRNRFLLNAGFNAVEYMYNMTRQLADNVTIAELPSGIYTRPVTHEDARGLWDVYSEAFVDHPGFISLGEAGFIEWKNSVYFDPDLCLAAWQGDRMVGIVVNHVDADENRQFKRERGYLLRIGTLRDWRRRGVARALISRSLLLLKEKGCQEAALRVNVRNPTGALQLYESLGFKSISQLNILEKDV